MSAFLEDEGSPPPLDEEEVFDLVGGSLGHLRMSRPLEQITTRGYTHHRRRAAVTAMAGVAAITALGAAVAFAQSAGNAVRAVSTASGTVGVASTARMTDPDWTVTADPAAGYAVDITALGDVAELNATLKSLGVELKVVEETPSGSQSACPAVGGVGPTTSIPATGTATVTTTASTSTSASASSSPTQSTPATDDSETESDPFTPSTAMTSPDAPSPTPTPVSFAASGTAAAFTFGDLPKESALSFISTDGRSRPLLGTVRISDECLPVFGTQP